MANSTTERGDVFETRVLGILHDMLESDDFPINPKFCKIFLKKPYYSSKRKSNIIIDISIECCLPGEEPFLFFIIECKDYNHPVPVDDIEEFYAKTQQITGLNVKAIFVTTSTLQKGALNFAHSSGIRVMKIGLDDNREILSYRRVPAKATDQVANFINAFLSLSSETSALLHPATIGLADEIVFYSLSDLINFEIKEVF